MRLVNVVVAEHFDHLEYRNGKPEPIWEREGFIAALPYTSLDDRKVYPTVAAYLDSKANSAGKIPYAYAWWWAPPRSTSLWAG